MKFDLGCVNYNLDGSCRDNAIQQEIDLVAYRPAYGTAIGTPDSMLPVRRTIGTMLDPAYSFDFTLTPESSILTTYGPYLLAAGLAVAALAFSGRR